MDCFFVRNIVMKPGYYTECGKNRPYAGDYLGQPAATRWKVVGFECQKDGGPYHWFHQYYRLVLQNINVFCDSVIKYAEYLRATIAPESARLRSRR